MRARVVLKFRVRVRVRVRVRIRVRVRVQRFGCRVRDDEKGLGSSVGVRSLGQVHEFGLGG